MYQEHLSLQYTFSALVFEPRLYIPLSILCTHIPFSQRYKHTLKTLPSKYSSKQGTILMSHLYIPPCLHLDFVNNSGTIRNGFFQKTANSGYYSNRGRQIENIMYIIDKLGLTQLYLGTYVHYIKNGFQPYFRAFLCL